MAKNITLVHSSLLTQLVENAGFDVEGDPLWICRYNFTNPEAVIKSHIDFMKNGAQIILTNTYQASVEGFMKHLKLSRKESVESIKKIVKLAQKAREIYLKNHQGSGKFDLKNILSLEINKSFYYRNSKNLRFDWSLRSSFVGWQ
jgi:S-methylmethionine-dependent homocysteine/selenocysteine methylase